MIDYIMFRSLKCNPIWVPYDIESQTKQKLEKQNHDYSQKTIYFWS